MHAATRAVTALALLLGATAAPASAEECTYTDILGAFEVSVDCAGLEDHSNLGNEQKRMWLAGDWGQVNIIEVPQPYKQDPGQIDLVMSNLGRYYTERRSPGGVQETTVAGQDARVVLEHKMRTSSRSWVFHWEGRNLIMRAVAFGKKKERMERLDAMSEALTSSFGPATSEPVPQVQKMSGAEAPVSNTPLPADKDEDSRVRDRARDMPSETTEAVQQKGKKGKKKAEAVVEETSDELEAEKGEPEDAATDMPVDPAQGEPNDEDLDDAEEEAKEVENEAQDEAQDKVEDVMETPAPVDPTP